MQITWSARRNRDNVSSLAIALALLPLLAPVGDAAAQRLPIKKYTTEQGLAHNRIGRILTDSHGFLWFCTADGLSRFDGYQFTNYGVDEGLPAPSVNDLIDAGGGIYWIATNSDGLVRFDVSAANGSASDAGSRFTTYAVSRESPVANRVNVVYRDLEGILWAGTDGGVFWLDDARGERTFHPVALGIPSHPDIEVQVWALARDRDANLWIGTKFGLLKRSPDGRISRYAIQPSAADDNVWALLVDRAGTLWVGHRAGLIAFSPRAARDPEGLRSSGALPGDTRRYSVADGLAHETVRTIHESASGRIWIGTFDHAITEIDGNKLTTYRLGQTTGGNISSMTEDRDGNLWLGTNGQGAWKITKSGWTTYGGDDGLPLPVSSMFESRSGEMYVISAPWRISRYHEGSITTVRPGLPESVSDRTWRAGSGVIQDHAGEWWIATRDGILRFATGKRFEDLPRAHPAAVYTMRDGLPHNDVTRLFEDSRGDIWIGFWVPAVDVLVRWERKTGRFHRYTAADGLRAFTSATIFDEDRSGNVWVGFREGGLARYRAGRFTMVTSERGLPVGGVNGLYVDDAGRLWATVNRGGLSRIDDPNGDGIRVRSYTKAQGLASDVAFSVTGDLAGGIYVSSSRGIDRLDPDTGSVKHYSTPEGLAGGEYKGALRDRAGALWFCATTGISRLESEPAQPAASPPILVTGLRIAGVAKPLLPLGQTSVSHLALGPGENNIQIDFAAIDFRPSGSLRYQYALEGAADGWNAPTAQRGVNYAGLASGSYRFRVRTVSPEGTAGDSEATVAFDIAPPVWRRWWFIIIVLSILSLAAAAFTRSRNRRKRAEAALRAVREQRLAELERVRKRIAADLHDDIGSSLTRISLLSEVVRQRIGATEESVADSLSSIATLARELVDSMSDIVWAINPTKDHVSDLSQRMRLFASDVFTARQIQFRFRAPDMDREIAVGANVRRELFLMFKEAVNNVVRHSRCSEVVMEFLASPAGLVLSVRDNGRGFNLSSGSDGHGLASMRRRTEGLGGQFEITSQPGQGTCLTFLIPFTETFASASAPASGRAGSLPT